LGFISVKSHYGQGNSYKGKTFNWSWLTVSEVQSIVIMAGSMAAGRHTWHWKNQEFSILI
jgi:alpha-mannosidase